MRKAGLSWDSVQLFLATIPACPNPIAPRIATIALVTYVVFVNPVTSLIQSLVKS